MLADYRCLDFLEQGTKRAWRAVHESPEDPIHVALISKAGFGRDLAERSLRLLH